MITVFIIYPDDILSVLRSSNWFQPTNYSSRLFILYSSLVCPIHNVLSGQYILYRCVVFSFYDVLSDRESSIDLGSNNAVIL